MPEEIKKESLTPSVPLLMEDLAEHERAALAHFKSTFGYAVVVKILNAACEKATAEAIKLSPEEDNYIQKLTFRQQRARDFSELSASFFKTVDYHVKRLVAVEQKENKDAVDAVGKVFGIHTVESKSKFK